MVHGKMSSGMSYWEERRAPIEPTGPAFSGKPVGHFGPPSALVSSHPLPLQNRIKIAVTPWTTGQSMQKIWRAGGDPIEIKSNTPTELLEQCGGLLIPGGRDVDPALYGQANTASQTPDRDRDEYEIALIKYAMRHKMAILGICRGHQLLNVAMGGTLIQDIAPGHPYKHPVTFDGEHPQFRTVKGLEMVVNSLHHQGVDTLGKNMKALAWAPDGLVEAIMHTKRKFVLGVQWHPEMSCTARFDRGMEQLVWQRFVNAGRENIKARKVQEERVLAQAN